MEELARLADCYTSVHPNAGLPNPFGGYDEGPETTSALLREFARERPRQYRRRLLRHDARPHEGHRRCRRGARPARRARAPAPDALQRARALCVRRGHELRHGRRAHERDRLGALPATDRVRRLPGRARRRARPGTRRREPPRRQHGRRPPRLRGGHDAVPQPRGDRARGRAPADHGRQLALVGDRGRAQVRAGQGRRQLAQPQGGRGGLPGQGAHGAPLRRRGRRHGLRRARPGGHRRPQGRDLRARLPPARGRGRVQARGHRLRPEHPRHRDGDGGARRLREGVHRGRPADQGALPGREDLGRRLEPLLLVPRQRGRPRGDPLGLPLPRHSGRPRHGHRQRRPARRLRGHPAGSPRARRGHRLRPPPGRDRAHGHLRRDGEGGGDEARGRPLLAGGSRRGAAFARARPRDRRLHRGGHRGGAAAAPAPARRDRGPAHGRDVDRGRPLRLGPHVPARRW